MSDIEKIAQDDTSDLEKVASDFEGHKLENFKIEEKLEERASE